MSRKAKTRSFLDHLRSRIRGFGSILRFTVLLCLLLCAAFLRQWWWPPFCHLFAQRNLDLRDFDSAMLWLDRVTLLGASNADTWLLRARAFRKQGRMEDVQKSLAEAYGAGADVDRLQLEEWLSLAQSGQMSQAERHLPKLLEDQPEDIEEVCEAYVTGYMRTMNFAVAAELLEVWVKDFPTSYRPLLLKGRICLVTDQYREAEQVFRKAWEISGSAPEVGVDLARALTKLNRPEESTTLLRPLVSDRLFGREARFQLAMNLRSSGQADEAESILAELTKDQSIRSEVAMELARTQLELGDLEKAESSIRRALALAPKDQEVHYVLGQILQAQGKTDLAQTHFQFSHDAQQAIRELNNFRERVHRDPKDIEGLIGMGRIMIRYGQPEEGVVRLLAALELNPAHREARELLYEHYQERAATDPKFQKLADEQKQFLANRSEEGAQTPAPSK